MSLNLLYSANPASAGRTVWAPPPRVMRGYHGKRCDSVGAQRKEGIPREEVCLCGGPKKGGDTTRRDVTVCWPQERRGYHEFERRHAVTPSGPAWTWRETSARSAAILTYKRVHMPRKQADAVVV
ncbi:hypothetical protein DPEC_G00226840 [Dallia pectoralis]|uniref:Uncharacterized protein n=1 Tax=Dallia pectoralis TaxID=75939 RepID=A0ACC2G128_DALPE|nr:hypothetical protein DPEC_G00226840 [Dallia pectoralis]